VHPASFLDRWAVRGRGHQRKRRGWARASSRCLPADCVTASREPGGGHTGLEVRAELDRGSYPLGVKVADRELAAVPLRRHGWHGERNYTVLLAAA